MGNGIYGIGSTLDIYFSGSSSEGLSEAARREIITRIKYPNLTSGSKEYSELIGKRLNFSESIIEFPKREKIQYTDIFPFLTERIGKEV